MALQNLGTGADLCVSIFIDERAILRNTNDEALEVVRFRHGEDDGVILRLGSALDYGNSSACIVPASAKI